jgi:hypothetical protein
VFGIHPHCTQWCRDVCPRNGLHLEADTDVVLIYFTMPGALRFKVSVCNGFLARRNGCLPLADVVFLSENSLR